MSRRKIKAGSTSVMLPIFVQDSTATDGSGLGSLVHNTASLAARYRRAGASSWTTISLVTATLGTFTSGGFITSSGVTGSYEVGIPDAALAAGASWVEIEYYGATNMVPVKIEIELDAINYQDGVRAGLTALPNAAADAAGGLPISDAGGLDLDAKLATATSALALASDMAKVPKSDGSVAFNATAVSGITVAMEAAILNEGDATALLAAIAAKVEEFLVNEGDATATIAAIATACNAAVVAGTVGTNVGAIKAKTDLIPASPAATGDIPSAATIADAVWDEALSGHATAGSAGAALSAANAPTAAAVADAVWDEALSEHAVAGSAGAALSAANAPTAASVADAVWDEALSGHAAAGSAGAALSAAGNAGDPWQTALPGAYTAGQAGYIIGNQPTAEDIASELAGNNVVATFPLLIEGEETQIVQGEDYYDADGNAATVTINATGIEAAVADDWDFKFWGQGDSTSQVVSGSPSSSAANTITIKFDLPAAKTSLVTAGLGGWRVIHKPDATTRKFSEVEGILRVKPEKAAAS